jgi:homopolymeric O-antigen transport system permease protein
MASSITYIGRKRGLHSIDWQEVWAYRELLMLLTWRDLKVRYKQTVLGASWAIIQPLLTMLVFTLLFHRLAGMPSDDLPYPLFVLAALVPWMFLANAIGASAQSLVGSAHLITRVYFPRVIIPLSSILSGLVDLAITLVLMFAMMEYYGVGVGPTLVLLPVLVAMTCLTALGIGAGIAALTVSYRDFRYVVPFGLQLWMLVTPVVFPVSAIPQGWRWVINVNPMSGIIDGYRAAFLSTPIPWSRLSISLLSAAVLFLVGMMYFRKVERSFADFI